MLRCEPMLALGLTLALPTLALPMLAQAEEHPAKVDLSWVSDAGPVNKLIELDRVRQQRALARLGLSWQPTAKRTPIAAGQQVEARAASHELSFDFDKQEIVASTTLEIGSLVPSLTSVYVIAPALEVGGTRGFSDGGGALTASDVGQGVYQVALRAPLAAGQSVMVTVKSSGRPICDQGAQVQTSCRVDPALTFAMSGQWEALAVDLLTSQVLRPQQGSMAVTVDAAISVVASALNTGVVDNPDGTRTHSFENNLNGTFALAAAPFSVGATPFAGDKQLSTFVLPSVASNAASWRGAAITIIDFHQQRYGAFEFPKLDIAQVPDATGAAFGPYSTVFIPGSVLAQSPDDFSQQTTLAHELAHQWFGNMIGLDDPSSPWLNEGFATFAEMEFTIAEASKHYGVDYGPTYRALQRGYYLYLMPAAEDVPISSLEVRQISSTAYYLLTYIKGALVAGLLRQALGGDGPFRAAIKAYRQDHLLEGASVTSLAASFKAATGTDVSPLLAKWAYDSGYPTYSVAVRHGAAPSGGQKKHRVTIVVTADRDFAVDEEVEIGLAGGQRVRRKLVGPGLEQTVVYESDAEVLAVRFDPDNQIPCRSKSALPGEISINGEVDGIDLIYGAWAVGQTFEQQIQAGDSFAAWADLVFDGKIDSKDLELVLDNFATRSGEGG